MATATPSVTRSHLQLVKPHPQAHAADTQEPDMSPRSKSLTLTVMATTTESSEKNPLKALSSMISTVPTTSMQSLVDQCALEYPVKSEDASESNSLQQDSNTLQDSGTQQDSNTLQESNTQQQEDSNLQQQRVRGRPKGSKNRTKVDAQSWSRVPSMPMVVQTAEQWMGGLKATSPNISNNSNPINPVPNHSTPINPIHSTPIAPSIPMNSFNSHPVNNFSNLNPIHPDKRSLEEEAISHQERFLYWLQSHGLSPRLIQTLFEMGFTSLELLQNMELDPVMTYWMQRWGEKWNGDEWRLLSELQQELKNGDWMNASNTNTNMNHDAALANPALLLEKDRKAPDWVTPKKKTSPVRKKTRRHGPGAGSVILTPMTSSTTVSNNNTNDVNNSNNTNNNISNTNSNPSQSPSLLNLPGAAATRQWEETRQVLEMLFAEDTTTPLMQSTVARSAEVDVQNKDSNNTEKNTNVRNNEYDESTMVIQDDMSEAASTLLQALRHHSSHAEEMAETEAAAVALLSPKSQSQQHRQQQQQNTPPPLDLSDLPPQEQADAYARIEAVHFHKRMCQLASEHGLVEGRDYRVGFEAANVGASRGGRDGPLEWVNHNTNNSANANNNTNGNNDTEITASPLSTPPIGWLHCLPCDAMLRLTYQTRPGCHERFDSYTRPPCASILRAHLGSSKHRRRMAYLMEQWTLMNSNVNANVNPNINANISVNTNISNMSSSNMSHVPNETQVTVSPLTLAAASSVTRF